MPTRARASAGGVKHRLRGDQTGAGDESRRVALERLGAHVLLRPAQARDRAAFLDAVAASRALHAGWVRPPATPEAFRDYLRRYAHPVQRDPLAAHDVALLAFERKTGALAGAFNLSEIVRGALQGAFLGYYGFAGMTGRGLMREGLELALDAAFGPLRLHRLEANVQPVNHRSRSLVEAVGFAQEGFSPRYLKVAGRWRDHVRYAMLVDDWRRLRRGGA